MIDPLPSNPQFLQNLIEPLAARVGLQTVHLHTHEIIFAFALYQFLDSWVAPTVSTWLFPTFYPDLPLRTKINWNIHLVSLFQSVLICTLAFWVIIYDNDRRFLDANGRILGYNGATGMTQAFAAGYFLWDVLISVRSFSILGPGSLAHAISALIIVCLGFVSLVNSSHVQLNLIEPMM